MEHVVGIGGYAISDNTEDAIKTFALSTCVGLVYFNMRKRCLGMAHIQLPTASSSNKGDLPSRFADIAPRFLLEEMMGKFGVHKGEILVSLFGGISPRSQHDCFRIGERNLEIVKNALQRLDLIYSDVDTGGQESRTLIASVGTGVIDVIKRPMIIH